MNWHQHFQEVFFETWQQFGLPHHKDFLGEYVDMREHGAFKTDWLRDIPKISASIDGHQLHSVYGFGVTTSKLLGKLLGLDEIACADSVDWCGRFNLSISLFDYICDEETETGNFSSLEVFRPFFKSSSVFNYSLTPAEALLSKLAGGVLDDLKRLSSKRAQKLGTGSFFKLLKRMFDAEMFLSKERLTGNADRKRIQAALQLKSAEPFRLMAEYITRMARPGDRTLITQSRRIGRALGNCYLVIDDARDVCTDLRADQWNLFLLMSVIENPQLFENYRRKTSEAELFDRLIKSKEARKISVSVVRRLLKVINGLPSTHEERKHCLGLVAASLWQWYNY